MSAAQYGELVKLGGREAGRGAAVLAATSHFDEPGEVLDAYSDVLRAIVEHVEFIFGSDLNRRFSEWQPELHVEIAMSLWLQEMRAMAYAGEEPLRQPADGDSPCSVAWRRASACIRGAQELLSTHFGPLDKWRSPDAWAIDDPDGRRAALAHMAKISSVMTLAGPSLLSRCERLRSGDSQEAVDAVRQHHSPTRMLSVGLRDVGHGISDGKRAVEQLRAASAFNTSSADPMERVQEQLRSLRKQLFDLESQQYVGAGVTKDVATVLAGAHGHLSVVLRACGSNAGSEGVESLADASVEASKAWGRIRTEWNVVDSPTPADVGITETSVSMLRDLREVTRDEGGWKPAADIRGPGIRPLTVQRAAEDALVQLSGTASSLEAIASRQVGRGQLLGHAHSLPREFVTGDLSAVRARLDGKGVVLPRLMSLHLQDDIEAASALTRSLAAQVKQQAPNVLPVQELPVSTRRRGAVARYPTVPAARRTGVLGEVRQRSR